jgi:hypothetical protein
LKRWKLEPSLKDIYKCPFMIHYSFVAYSENEAVKKPDIFYHVKITKVNFIHTCQLTTIFSPSGPPKVRWLPARFDRSEWCHDTTPTKAQLAIWHSPAPTD